MYSVSHIRTSHPCKIFVYGPIMMFFFYNIDLIKMHCLLIPEIKTMANYNHCLGVKY